MSREGLIEKLVGDLLPVRPAVGSRWVALRASTTRLLALTPLASLGRMELAAYAAFGALLLTQVADRLPTGELLQSRVVETLLGVVVGLAVAVLTRSRRRLPSRHAGSVA